MVYLLILGHLEIGLSDICAEFSINAYKLLNHIHIKVNTKSPNRLSYTDNHWLEYYLNISSNLFRNCVNLGKVIF